MFPYSGEALMRRGMRFQQAQTLLWKSTHFRPALKRMILMFDLLNFPLNIILNYKLVWPE